MPNGAVRQPAWVDADGDGDLDLFVGLRDQPNALFRNDRGLFTEVAATLGLADPRKTVGAVWFDFDEDGDLDLAVANMDGDANGLFRNDGGRFADVAEAAGVAWGGRKPADAANGTVRVCAADMDGDGRLDLLGANYGPLGYFVNRGQGRFDDRAAAAGLAIDSRYDACAPADVDHDGRLDLYVNGTVTGGVSYKDTLYPQHGRDVRRRDAGEFEGARSRSRRAVGRRRRRRRSRPGAHRVAPRRHALRDAQPAAGRRRRADRSRSGRSTRLGMRRWPARRYGSSPPAPSA